jgi:hypothetical protein
MTTGDYRWGGLHAISMGLFSMFFHDLVMFTYQGLLYAIVTCFMNGSEWSLFSEISMDPLTSTNQSSQHLSGRLGSDG